MTTKGTSTKAAETARLLHQPQVGDRVRCRAGFVGRVLKIIQLDDGSVDCWVGWGSSSAGDLAITFVRAEHLEVLEEP